MSATGGTRTRRDRLPAFGLVCRYDDPDEPAEVTVYVDDPAVQTTAWLSIDLAHAVPLECVPWRAGRRRLIPRAVRPV